MRREAVRNVRLALIVAATVVVATAASAPAAGALEVTNEDRGQHCAAVTPAQHETGAGGCEVGIVSEGAIEWASPLAMINCNSTFEARADEAGAGYIYNQALTACSPTQVVPCAEGTETENWPVQLVSTTQMEAQFCTDLPPFFQDVRCHLPNISVNQINHGLVELFTTGHQGCEQIGYSFSGHWVATDVGPNHPGLELIE